MRRPAPALRSTRRRKAGHDRSGALWCSNTYFAGSAFWNSSIAFWASAFEAVSTSIDKRAPVAIG